jgi:hypothetical protein
MLQSMSPIVPPITGAQPELLTGLLRYFAGATQNADGTLKESAE